MNEGDNDNFIVFRDCLSVVITEKLGQVQSKPRKKRHAKNKPSVSPAIERPRLNPEPADTTYSDTAELAEFIDVRLSRIQLKLHLFDSH